MKSSLLSIAQMYRADALAIAGGVAGIALMERAGWAIAREVRLRWTPRRVTVLCGPGNNGGDGFVVAHLLARDGWPVRLALLVERTALKGDAALAADSWRGPIEPASIASLDRADLVIDALFGAGLTRPLEGIALALVQAINARHLACLSVDVPSGVNGDTGEILGDAPCAVATVTFFRKKPGHLLLPGRLACGPVTVADIGIPDRTLDDIAPDCFENGPELWRADLPRPRPDGHKYSRGHAVVTAGEMTGAAILAARSARRIGGGLVTIASPRGLLDTFRVAEPGAILTDLDDFPALLLDRRRNAVLVGPGAGVGNATLSRALAAAQASKALVLDADALSSLAGDPVALRGVCGAQTILTPHDGEFARLFTHEGDRLSRAKKASAQTGAIILLKGADTVIAAPDGRAAINTNAPPDLATAGSGDVLAGIILGLLAQGMEPFLAAAAAAWLHGAAAARIGRGLIAEDLPEAVVEVLRNSGF
jgi:hydroxyethylthiazole kinase-like uncharacterized protein yjeF